MKIGLRLFYNEGWLGGVNYVLSIARMLRLLPGDERPQVAFLTAAPAAVELAHGNSYLADEIAPVESAAAMGLDFVFPATQLAEATFGVPWGGWIPDWQCRRLPEFFGEEERARRFLQYRALAEGPVVCVISSRQAFDDTTALLGPAPGRLRRIFHFPAAIPESAWTRSPEEIAAARRKYGAPDRYLIVCNQFWRHKNHVVIAEALARAADLDVHVVMTGALEDSRWPDYATRVKSILSDPAVKGRVTLTGRIDREEQIDLMLGASGYVQPSLFEGWSTFVEEARALGLPGLLSDIPVHREQNPDGGRFFKPGDADQLAQLLRSFPLDPPRDRAAARRRHEERMLDCGRTFLAIAQDARSAFVRADHEAAFVLSSAMRKAWSEFQLGGLTPSAFDRFAAGLRQVLRTHPEDLARFAEICAGGDPTFVEIARSAVVDGSLAKMPADLQARFDAAARGRSFSTDALNAETGAIGAAPAPIGRRLSDFAGRAMGFARRVFR